MKTLLSTALALLALASVALTAGDQTQALKLQQAIDLIETAGDPDRATPLLEEAAEGSDRVVAARALFYLARLQERQDMALARRTYGRIVMEFSSVADVAAEAGRRLAATEPAPAEAPEQAPTLVCEQCGDLYGSISPDGRLFATPNSTGNSIGMDRGELGIRVLATQALTPLEIDGARKADGQLDGSALFPVFSPNAQTIAYVWTRGGQEPSLEVRTVRTQPGAQASVVRSFSPAELIYVRPVAWMASDTLLIIAQKPDRIWDLRTISVTDATMTQLRSLNWRIIGDVHHVSLSPDSRYIAYRALATNPPAPVNARQAAALEQQIYVLALDGRSEAAITTGAGQKGGPVWTPDGRWVLYLSDVSDGTWDLWAAPMAEGRRTGAAVLAKKAIGAVASLGVTGSGTYHYYESRPGVFQFSIADVTLGASGAQVNDRVIGGLPTWSPDGRRLAFHRAGPDGNLVVVRTVADGLERVYRRQVLADRPSLWFADGSGLLVQGPDEGGPALFRLDLDTGEFQRLAKIGADSNVLTIPRIRALSPDDRTVYMGAYRDESQQVVDRIVALDLATGRYRDVFRFSGPAGSLPNGQQTLNIAVSPDGQTLVLNWRDRAAAANGAAATHLATVGIDGQEFRELVQPYRASTLRNKLVWSQDGEWIYFALNVGDESDEVRRAMRVMRARPAGGSPEPVGVEAVGLDSFDVSPDGRQIAFYTLQQEDSADAIWTLDVSSALQAGQ
jgi:Tol biopolymer transport system component